MQYVAVLKERRRGSPIRGVMRTRILIMMGIRTRTDIDMIIIMARVTRIHTKTRTSTFMARSMRTYTSTAPALRCCTSRNMAIYCASNRTYWPATTGWRSAIVAGSKAGVYWH